MRMLWLLYGVLAIVCWGLWGFVGKVALRGMPWTQIALFYGLGILAVALGLMMAGRGGESIWSVKGLVAGVGSGALGTAGLAMFYLALEHGKASVIVPLTGVYPAVTILLSALFLEERVSAVQVLGVGLALVAVALIGLGE